MAEPGVEQTIAEVLLGQATLRPDAPAVTFPAAEIRYGELLTKVRHRARVLLAAGVAPGDFVGVAMDDGAELLFVMLGATLAGATPVLFSEKVRDTLAPRLNELKIRLLISSGERGRSIRAALDDTADLDLIDAGEPHYALLLSQTATNTGPLTSPADTSAPAFVVFTAGVTGTPKHILVSHHSVLCKAGPTIAQFQLSASSRLWIGVSMFQIGFIAPLVAALACGASVVLSPGLDDEGKRAMIASNRVTHAYPIYLQNWLPILSSPSFMPSQFSMLTHVCLTGPVGALRRTQRALPQATVVTTYGSAEEGGAFCISDAQATADRRFGTSGRPFPEHEVRIFDSVAGKALGRDQIGEIQVRGAGLPLPAPDSAFGSSYTSDGWLKTSDLGILTQGGELIYRGRISEMLRVGEEAVSALDIEAALAQHPDVAVAQVIGWPDDSLGEVAAAFVELRPGATANSDDLIRFAGDNLPPALVPRTLTLVSEWPTASSKILKSVLRDQMAQDSLSQRDENLVDRAED